MYAVIRTGGKQYRVAAGDVIRVERLPVEVGATLDLDQVLMIGGGGDGAAPRIGAPVLDGVAVRAEVLDQIKGPKLLVFKKKRRKNYRRKRGHRQLHTVLCIQDIPGS